MPLERILVVEDQPELRAIAELALGEIGGFRVCLCEDGAAALAAFAGFDPDLLLLDVVMPGLDGPATLAALRALPAWRSAPVVFMTGRAGDQEVAGYRALGAAGVIAKPFDPMSLADEARRIWQEAQAC